MSARPAFAAAFAAVLVLALVPWTGGPLRRLAGEGESGAQPDFDVPFQVDAAFQEVEDDSLYFVDATDRTPLEQGNLKAIGQLYFAHALPVQDRARARWVLSLRGDEVTLSLP